MKKLYQFKTLLLLAVFSLFAGTAMAQTKVVFDFNQDTEDYGSGVTPKSNTDLVAGTTTFTNGDVTFKYETKGGGTNLRWWSDGIRAYSGNEFSVNTTDGEITSIAFEGTITVVETSSTSGTISSNTWTAPSGGGVTSVTFKGNHTSKNKTITKITVTLATGGGDTKTATVTSFPQDSYSINLGDAFTAPTASVSDDAGTPILGAPVTYASDNQSVATVDASTGAVTVLATGSAKITATYEGDDTYKPSSASYTLNVAFVYTHAGTAADPFTVEEAIAKARENGSNSDGNTYYTAGTISQVDSYNSNYKSITYWISDPTSPSNEQLEVYSGKGLNSADFSSVDDLAVGYDVVVAGELKNYQNTTPEYDKNNYLVSLDTHGTVVVAKPTFDPAAGEVAVGTVVTVSAATDCTLKYTTDGSDPANAAPIDGNTAQVTVNADLTIRAIAVDGDGNESEEASAAYTALVVINAPTFTESSREVAVGTTVQFQIQSDDSSMKVWYTTDGSDPTTSATAVQSNRFYASVELTINAKTTVKAVATDGNGNFSDVATLTFSVPVPTVYAKVTSNADIEDGKSYLLVYTYEATDVDGTYTAAKVFTGELSTTSTKYGLVSDDIAVAADGTIDISSASITPVVINAATDGYTMQVGDDYLAWSSGNSLKTQADAYSWGIDVTADPESVKSAISNENGGRYLLYNTGSPRFASYVSTTSVNGFVSLYKEVGSTPTPTETIDVTIGSTGYATLYYSDKSLSIPAGVTASIIYVENGIAQSEDIAAGEDIPFGTGVILNGTPGDYQFAVADGSNDAWLMNNNLLYGSDVETDPVGASATDVCYKLSLNSAGDANSVGFYRFTAGEKSGAHKAYLAVPADQASNIRAFLLNGDVVSGIANVAAEQSNANAYDLAGRRVKNADKGLYIINGKKVIK